MPNETDNNGQGVDDSKVEEKSTEVVADNKGDDESITIKKSDLRKIEEERDNYRKGLLAKKADERELTSDQSNNDGSTQPTAVIDEKKINETATVAASKVLRDAGEKTAKREFLADHPEYVDDGQWSSLMSHITFRGNEITKEDIRDRMEAAVLEHKRVTGKLEDYLKLERERGKREGIIEGQLGYGFNAGGAGDRNENGKTPGSFSSPKGEEMARSMHVDAEKAKKINPPQDNVINVL